MTGLAGLAVALAACASDGDRSGPPRDGPHGPGGPGGGAGLNVFISPSGEPFRAGPQAPYPSAAWFRGADLDGDGRLTPAEFTADAERAFHRFDRDGDGVIDGFEITAYEETTAPEILPRVGRLAAGEGMDPALFSGRGGRAGRSGARREGGAPPRPARSRAGDITLTGAEPYAMLAEPEPLRAADADLDGRVTLAEWRARTKRRFALLDEKGAGALTLDALPKTTVQQMLERRRARDAAKRAP